MAMVVILTQCFPPAVGGIENLMGSASRRLAARGHKVVVLADGRGDPSSADVAGADVRYFSGWRPLRRLRKALALRALVNRPGFDAALFADSWKSLETLKLSGVASRFRRIVAFAHGNEYPDAPSPRKRRRIEAALPLASAILANSRFTRDRVAGYAGAQHIELRPPPIEDRSEVTADDAAWAATLWGNAGPRLVSLCRLEPLKGIDNALKAVAQLTVDHPHLRYVIAGGGDDLDRLKGIAADLGLDDRVVFAGVVVGGRKSALLSSADVFLMPTRREGKREEGFGMVFAEAALHGLPAVAGDSGGAADAVQDSVTGFVVPGRDVDAIAGAMRRLIEDRPFREQMAAAAVPYGRNLTWNERLSVLEADLGIA